MSDVLFIVSSLGTAFVFGYSIGMKLLAFKRALEISAS